MTVSTAATIITPLSTTICQSCQCWGWGEFLPSFSTNFVITTYLQATLHKVPPNYLKPFMGTLWITTVQAHTGFSSKCQKQSNSMHNDIIIKSELFKYVEMLSFDVLSVIWRWCGEEKSSIILQCRAARDQFPFLPSFVQNISYFHHHIFNNCIKVHFCVITFASSLVWPFYFTANTETANLLTFQHFQCLRGLVNFI